MLKRVIKYFLIVFLPYAVTGQNKMFGTWESYRWSCCFGQNCYTKFVLTIKKDSTCLLEEYKYKSPTKGKWWKYTLQSYQRQYNKINMRGDTLLQNDNLFAHKILFKNGQILTYSDAMIMDAIPDKFNSDKLIRKRQFKRKKCTILHRRKIRKYIFRKG